MNRFLQWLAGNGQYDPLGRCLHLDFWTARVLFVDHIFVLAGFTLIAFQWWRAKRSAKNCGHCRRVLNGMLWVFILCGLCGVMHLLLVVWPVWRLYAVVFGLLAVVVWYYAWNARSMTVVYHEIDKVEKLTSEKDGLQAELELTRRVLRIAQERVRRDFGA